MQLLAPDVLELTRQLSPSVTALAVVVGLLLWLFGLRHHRFWLGLAVTLAAGVAGLFVSRDFGLQPLVAGLLFALAAGVLSLALARIALFAAGGAAFVLLCRAANTGWNELVCFVLGGLLGVALYPLWVAVLSSLAGTVLMVYGLVSLLDRYGQLDSLGWAGRNAPLINWGLVAWAMLGVLVQLVLERRRLRMAREAEQPGKERREEKLKAPPPPPPPPLPEPKGWWRNWGRKSAA
jgi:hypothetical protein